MDLLEVMRTTFACRDFQNEEIEDEVIHRILDNARFAPSGGNRQGIHVVVVKNSEKKRKLGQLCGPTLLLYAAQQKAGEVPFNTVQSSSISEQEIDTSSVHDFEMFNRLQEVPLLLLVSIDLSEVASMDKDLERIGLVTGASVYPFVWNILMAARNEGLGGVITTAIVPEEESVREILDLPENHAIAAMIPIGKPVKQLSQLTRRNVEDFTTVDSYEGNVFKTDSK
jgi:nitroreductase|tara:strand:+ start:254 stop:931 length:678 start_codon:yes stop_codon:yes gene_type:complete